MATSESIYSLLLAELKEITLLGSVCGILGWDERTQMPERAAGLRADQLSLMAKLIHQRFTSPKIGDWLSQLESSSLDEDANDLGDLDAQFAKGDFIPLLGWLRENIHRHGKRYSAGQLAKRITGKELSAEPLIRHLKRKAVEVYQLAL